MATHALSICHSPLIKGYLRHAYLFSILGTRDDYLPWTLSGNYTQLVFDPDPGWMPLDFYAPQGYTGTAFLCPFLDTQWMDRNIVKLCFGSASAFLDQVLKQGYYAAFTVDEYHVPGRAAYGRTHFMHRVLVFGVDADRFSVMGYDEAGKYGPSVFGRDQLDRAFCFAAGSLPDEGEISNFPPPTFDGTGSAAWLKQFVFSEAATSIEPNRIWLVRHLPALAQTLDPAPTLGMLSDYVSSADTSARVRMVVNYPNKVPPPGAGATDSAASRRVYGLQVYDALARWLEQTACEKRPLSLIPFHILLEHKQLMQMRLRFMEAESYLEPRLDFSERYRAVVKAAAALKLCILRRVARPRTESTAAAQAALESLRDRESQILSQVLESTRCDLPTPTVTDGGPV